MSVAETIYSNKPEFKVIFKKNGKTACYLSERGYFSTSARIGKTTVEKTGMLRFQFRNGGRFISRGHGRHPVRIIDSYELIYVVSGTLGLFEENRVFHISPGERVLLFPGRRHGGASAYPLDLSFFWVHFLPRNNAAAREFAALEQYAKVCDSERYQSYLQMLLAEQKSGDVSACDHLLNLLLEKTARTVPANVSPPLRLAEAAEQLIRLHFEEELSAATLSESLHCHPDYLGRIFRQEYGCSIGDAIRRRRIAHACKLLENSMLSIKEICFESGFNDPSYFRRQFFRECALTPREYRVLHSGEHVNTE